MKRRVVFSPEAQQDLFELYDYIAERSGAERAMSYIERIESFCLGMATFPKRGTKRDDLRPGLRTAGFMRRATVAFHIETGAVTIDRILYGGGDLNRVFKRNSWKNRTFQRQPPMVGSEKFQSQEDCCHEQRS